MPKCKESSNEHTPQAWPGVPVSSIPPLGVPAGAAVIIVVVLLAYLPSISGGFVLDDNLLLTENKLIMASDGLYRFWCTSEPTDYWPVTNTTFWIEWRLWGMNSTGYHVTNLILHIVESLLIWIILRELSIPGAFLAAAIFAVHPVNVESVAWIAQRKNMMAMLFFLLSILCYVKFIIRAPLRVAAKQYTSSSLIPHPPSLIWYWLSLAAFVLAMLSKGSVAVLPVLLLGIVWWLGTSEKKGTGTSLRSEPVPFFGDLVRIAPFFVVAIVLTGVNMWFQTHGKDVELRTVGFAERLLGAGGVVWFYLYKAFLPIDLAFIYPQWHIEAGKLLWWLPLSAALAVTVVLWLYRESWSRPILFAWGFLCVSLLPVMGFVDVGFMKYSLVADHYQHIAIIGVIALAAAGGSLWQKRAQEEWRRAAIGVAIVVVGALTFLTWRQSGIYRDSITLYQATLDKNPDCSIAHNNLGLTLFNAGRWQEPVEHYQKALQVKPDYADAHYNLGIALAKSGRLEEAMEHYKQAIQFKPDYIQAYNNLGYALVQAGRLQEAIDQFQQAERLDPNFPEIYNNLGNVFILAGQPQKAIEYCERALALKPDFPEPHYNLGNALVYLNRAEEAIEHYQQALALKPDYADAHNNLGHALYQAGRPQEAIEHYRQALRLNPNIAVVYYNLASAYASMRQSTEAIAAAQKAMELARSQGQADLAKQMEDWLKSYRAGLSDLPDTAPQSKSATPTP